MMTIPSGIFCKAIPTAILIACATFSVPKPTPAAMPSGKLWIPIAITKSNTLFIRLVCSGCASCSTPANLCKCGVTLSKRFKQNAPQKMPAIVISKPSLPPPYSNEGSIKPMIAAHSITPAAKERTISLNL